MIGNSLVALDAGFRVSKVLKAKEQGKEWEKTMVKETAGFGLGTAAGIAAGEYVIGSAVGVFLASTPAGWIILIGLGITAGYGASKFGDGIGQYVAGKTYETSSSIRWFD
ncbi:hypothetical protein AKG98_4205 [Moritella sp. JT01]|uniref:hypothetical protein n=1 Tax=Moritella sp. JT01 TaxID=756698 RepID=UPI000791C18B|nr:hypothetical protein [Moritella sp. JT01]KXO13005.1 hypothetical protein AKG98_4205 [Moritella sp. JT01]